MYKKYRIIRFYEEWIFDMNGERSCISISNQFVRIESFKSMEQARACYPDREGIDELDIHWRCKYDFIPVVNTEGMRFYKNPETDEVRIVKQLSSNVFAVVKLIGPSTYTLKLWNGSLDETAKFWNTKLVEKPSDEAAERWTKKFNDVWDDMTRYINK